MLRFLDQSLDLCHVSFGRSCFIGLPFTARSIVLQRKQLETSSMIFGFFCSKARHCFNTSSNLAWPIIRAFFHFHWSTNRCIKPSLWFDERHITYKMLFRFDDTMSIIINVFDTHSFSTKQATSAIGKFFSRERQCAWVWAIACLRIVVFQNLHRFYSVFLGNFLSAVNTKVITFVD